MMDEKLMNELKELFPGETGMFRVAERGDISLLQRYVYDNCQRGIHYQEVLSAHTLWELKEKASRMKRQWELYERISNGEY